MTHPRLVLRLGEVEPEHNYASSPSNRFLFRLGIAAAFLGVPTIALAIIVKDGANATLFTVGVVCMMALAIPGIALSIGLHSENIDDTLRFLGKKFNPGSPSP